MTSIVSYELGMKENPHPSLPKKTKDRISTTQIKNKLKNIAKKENIDTNSIYININNIWTNFNDWKDIKAKHCSCLVKYNIDDIEKYPKKICSIFKSGFLKNKCRTDKEWRDLIQEENPDYKIISEQPILNNSQEIVLLCPEGHEWRTNPNRAVGKRKGGCEICGNKKKSMSKKKNCAKKFLEEVKKDNPNVEILSEYKDSHTHVDCRCKICNHKWPAAATHLFGKTVTACPECGRKKTTEASTYSKEEVREIIIKHKPKNIIIPDNFEYTPRGGDVSRGYCHLFCTKKNHGNFKCYLRDIYDGIICGRCKKMPKFESHVMTYFDNKRWSYIHNKECGVKSVGRFDFQKINNMNVNLEYDGYPSHFDYTCRNSSTLIAFGRPKEKAVIGFIKRQIMDTNKNLYCLKNNIILIRIPYTIDTRKKLYDVLDKIFLNIENEKRKIIYIDKEIYINHFIKMYKIKCAIRTLQKKFRNKRKLGMIEGE